MREIRPSGLTRGKAALTTSHADTEAHKGKPGNMLDRRLNPNVPSLLYTFAKSTNAGLDATLRESVGHG